MEPITEMKTKKSKLLVGFKSAKERKAYEKAWADYRKKHLVEHKASKINEIMFFNKFHNHKKLEQAFGRGNVITKEQTDEALAIINRCEEEMKFAQTPINIGDLVVHKRYPNGIVGIVNHLKRFPSGEILATIAIITMGKGSETVWYTENCQRVLC